MWTVCATPVTLAGADPMWHLYPLRVLDGRRRALYEHLRANGIGVQVNYIPVYWHPVFEDLGYRRGLCPIAEQYYAEELSLPLFPDLSDDDVDRVIDLVRGFLRDGSLAVGLATGGGAPRRRPPQRGVPGRRRPGGTAVPPLDRVAGVGAGSAGSPVAQRFRGADGRPGARRTRARSTGWWCSGGYRAANRPATTGRW